jgi:ketosteroid isomerase-like protein
MFVKMTRERAEEFGAAWNSGDADLVASFFAEDGVYHASVGPDALGKSYYGKEQIRHGVQAFFDRFPGAKFENLKVVVAGDIGTFEWDFVSPDPSGQKVRLQNQLGLLPKVQEAQSGMDKAEANAHQRLRTQTGL